EIADRRLVFTAVEVEQAALQMAYEIEGAPFQGHVIVARRGDRQSFGLQRGGTVQIGVGQPWLEPERLVGQSDRFIEAAASGRDRCAMGYQIRVLAKGRTAAKDKQARHAEQIKKSESWHVLSLQIRTRRFKIACCRGPNVAATS